MEALVFWLLSIGLVWVLAWAQGHHTGVQEGKALRELQQAFERPMRKVKL